MGSPYVRSKCDQAMYVAQLFEQRGLFLHPGIRTAFPSATEAEEYCGRMLERFPGAVIFRLKGRPEAAVWTDSELLMTVGKAIGKIDHEAFDAASANVVRLDGGRL